MVDLKIITEMSEKIDNNGRVEKWINKGNKWGGLMKRSRSGLAFRSSFGQL